MHLFHIPQCSIQNKNGHISVLNGALWDMEQVHSGIRELGQNCVSTIRILWASQLSCNSSWIIMFNSPRELMGWCKKDVTPLLTHWSYVFLASTHPDREAKNPLVSVMVSGSRCHIYNAEWFPSIKCHHLYKGFILSSNVFYEINVLQLVQYHDLRLISLKVFPVWVQIQ